MRCSIRNINLPSAPPPTRAKFSRKVTGYNPQDLTAWEPGREPKPSPDYTLDHRLKERHEKLKRAKEMTEGQKRRQEAIRKARRAKADEKKVEAIRLWNEGKSVSEICEIIGRSMPMVGGYLREVRGARQEWSECDADIIRLYRKGWSYQAIADQIGVPLNRVKSRIKTLHDRGTLKTRRIWR